MIKFSQRQSAILGRSESSKPFFEVNVPGFKKNVYKAVACGLFIVRSRAFRLSEAQLRIVFMGSASFVSYRTSLACRCELSMMPLPGYIIDNQVVLMALEQFHKHRKFLGLSDVSIKYQVRRATQSVSRALHLVDDQLRSVPQAPQHQSGRYVHKSCPDGRLLILFDTTRRML